MKKDGQQQYFELVKEIKIFRTRDLEFYCHKSICSRNLWTVDVHDLESCMWIMDRYQVKSLKELYPIMNAFAEYEMGVCNE